MPKKFSIRKFFEWLVSLEFTFAGDFENLESNRCSGSATKYWRKAQQTDRRTDGYISIRTEGEISIRTDGQTEKGGETEV